MSRENVELVRRLHDAAARGDVGRVFAYYAPDVVWDVSGGPLVALEGSGVYRGHDGLRRFFRGWREAWENAEYVLDELIDAGDCVISVGSQRGRGRASGLNFEGADQAAVWTIRDGKIVRVAWFATREEALAAAGVQK